MTLEQVENAFSYHPPVAGQVARYEAIQSQAKSLAAHIATYCPPGRERDNALDRLREAVSWANAAIACNE